MVVLMWDGVLRAVGRGFFRLGSFQLRLFRDGEDADHFVYGSGAGDDFSQGLLLQIEHSGASETLRDFRQGF